MKKDKQLTIYPNCYNTIDSDAVAITTSYQSVNQSMYSGRSLLYTEQNRKTIDKSKLAKAASKALLAVKESGTPV